MITIHFDGSCSPTNPGFTGGIGAVINLNGEKRTISKQVKSSFIISNNVTEYMALVAALELLLAKGLEQEQVQVYGDSALVIHQMQGLMNIGKGFYVEQALKCRKLVGKFKNIKFQWIPREMNAEADMLADMRRRKQQVNNGEKTVKQRKFVEKIVTCERRVRKLNKEYQDVCA